MTQIPFCYAMPVLKLLSIPPIVIYDTEDICSLNFTEIFQTPKGELAFKKYKSLMEQYIFDNIKKTTK
jgi:hypothetical protein